MKPALALTMGDTNGIGPEILAKALARPEIRDICHPIVVGDPEVFEAAREFAPDCPRAEVMSGFSAVETPDRIPVLLSDFRAPALAPGRLDAEAGRCAVEWLKQAIRLALQDEIDGIVTCPLNKKGIHLAGYHYEGHTEILAEMTESPDFRMCLFAGPLRVVHVSSHCPLIRVVDFIKTDRIAQSIRIGHDALLRLGLERRQVAVAGLNPHAGEDGILGQEEAVEIAPAISRCQAEGIPCSGPYPPDTVFRRMADGEFDLVVAMYHDQGHIPMKLIAMDEGVNVTLGLPIIRTSVDHGTAYDIAGQGIARPESLCAAIRLAAGLAQIAPHSEAGASAPPQQNRKGQM